MLRKIASGIFLLTSAVIALGAFGHDSNATKLVAEFAKYPSFDPRTIKVLLAVWHFCSGCMFVLGVICAWAWWRARRGGREAFFASDAIGVFYMASGLLSVWYTGITFFWLFFVLGALLIAASLPLRRAA